MSFRQEKKILFYASDLKELLDFFRKEKINKIFEDRIVTSVYFDTHDFFFFRNSIEGIAPRFKIRIRSYDGEKNKIKYFLEEKHSLFDKRFKKTHKINLDEFKNYLNFGFFFKKKIYLQPKVKVEYKRSYFSNNFFRVTLDRNITYSKFNLTSKHFYNKIYSKDYVLEVKYSNKLSENFFLKKFSFKQIRNSKYCNGVEQIYNL